MIVLRVRKTSETAKVQVFKFEKGSIESTHKVRPLPHETLFKFARRSARNDTRFKFAKGSELNRHHQFGNLLIDTRGDDEVFKFRDPYRYRKR